MSLLSRTTVSSSGWRSHSLATRRSLFGRSAPRPQSPLRTAAYTTAFAISAGLFAVYYFDARSAIHRYFITPVLRHSLDAENGHKAALRALRSGLGPWDPLPDDDRLKCNLWDLKLNNPVGLAAGFDKDGEAIDGLFNLGFSWVEIGSVTPKPQEGNPKPRVFHLSDDSALINRYGFPSRGHTYVLARLLARKLNGSTELDTASQREGAVLAVNLGKNKSSPVESPDDYVAGVKKFGPYSDVLVINVSSPNTPGLRNLEDRKPLDQLLFSVARARDQLDTPRKPKLILKIAPDLSEPQLVDIASVIRNNRVDGVIVSNTTVQRPLSLTDPNKVEAGGLSGAPLKMHSLSALKTLRSQLPESIPLIGCGGIMSGADALEYAKAGASMVQMYTGFGYDGAGACRRVKDEILMALEKEGTTWSSTVGKAVKELSWKVKDEPTRESTIQNLVAEAKQLLGMADALQSRLSIT